MRRRSLRPSAKIEVRPSTGKGRGLFTTRPIRRGEVIEKAPVLLVPTVDEAALAASFLGHYMFQTDEGERYAVALGFVSLINHSDDANATFDVSPDEIVIRARRAIAKGTEVTIDYGWTPSEWSKVGVLR